MGKRGRVQSGSGVQMFPFLDALICTMGALLVLLHAFARHGQVEAVKKAEANRSTQGPNDVQADLEETRWRIGQLDEARGKTAAQLADERLRLSHVEDHARRLRQQWDQLRTALAQIERVGGSGAQQREQELAAAADKVRQAQQALQDALRAAKQRAATYSVVPYEGPNTTRRRPVYIECRDESVVLQPEGVELAPEDFALLGPGNPLASALRAMHEYFTRGPGGSNPLEPYPLLLVRPEGVGAYYAARAALDTWGSDFGYELVGSDWKLKFPEPDARLAELTRKVLAEARARQQEYVLASSQLARTRPRATFHASSRGGFTAERGSGGAGGGSGGAGPGGWDSLGSNWAARRGTGGTSDAGGAKSAGASGGSGALAGTQAGTDGAVGGPGGGRNDSSAAGGNSSPTGPAANSGAGSRYSQLASDSRYGPSDARGGADALATENGAQSGGGGPDSTLGQARSGSTTPGNSNSAGAQGSAANAGSAGQSRPGEQSSSSGSPSLGGSAAPDGSPSTPNLTLGASAPASQSKKTKSMAAARGRNWGLPDTGPAAAAATRPILVECHNDRLVIVPESSNQLPKEVPLGVKAQDSMDEFVSDVWQHMKRWGIAGKGLYWRPTLLMEVKPGAADRYAEVKALLDDSGLDVHERQPRAAANPPASKSTRK